MGEKLSFRDVSSEFTDDISIQYNTIFICHIRHLHMGKKMKKIDDRK